MTETRYWVGEVILPQVQLTYLINDFLIRPHISKKIEVYTHYIFLNKDLSINFVNCMYMCIILNT